jgi:AraC-like DNA-binding protein
MFRATKVHGYIKAMRLHEITATRLLAGTQIDPKRVSDPKYLISLEQYQAVIANMIKLTGNPGIAFSLGDTLNVGEFGILGYAMLSASSLRQAVSVWIEYGNSIVGTPINVESCHDISPGYKLVVSSPSKSSVLPRFETEELLVQGMKLVQDITGVKPVLGKVSFSYPEPAHRKLYEEFCQCPLEFGATKTVFRVLQPDMDAPIRTGNEELFAICEQHCRKVMRSIPEAGHLRRRLRSMFLATPGCLPDQKAASDALGISASTLRRQLNASGQTYQAIKDEFRFDLAREYLLSGQMAPKQVGHLLGFASPSAFARAFKTWTGKTVGQFLLSDEPG